MTTGGRREVVSDSDGRRWEVVRPATRAGEALACCLTLCLALRPGDADDLLGRCERAWNGTEPACHAGGADLQRIARVLDTLGVAARLTTSGGVGREPRGGWRFPAVAALDAVVPGSDTTIRGGGHAVVVAGRTRAGHLVCLDPRQGLAEVPASGFPSYRLAPPCYPFHVFRPGVLAVA